MKLFVLGIDGGDREVLQLFDMPFLNSLLEDHVNIKVTEDLFSRGWVEIYTGYHGRDTGAFYVRPEANGTHSFSKTFRLTEATSNPGVVPIWELANKRGYRCGFMNIPTTNPAPEVDGFFVSGSAGGGGTGGVVSDLPDHMAESANTLETLRSLSYVSDIRVIPTSHYSSLSAFFSALKEMVRVRTDAYLVLAKQHKPDFGFVAYRALTVVQYIAMSEIRMCNGLSGTGHDWVSAWKNELHGFYSFFDAQVERLFDTLDPQHFLIVSDHGAVPYLNRIDANHLLRKNDFQSFEIDWNWTAKNLIKAAMPFVSRFRAAVSSGIVRRRMPHAKTFAFSHSWYIPGIYLNDKRRFGGPVKEGAEQERLVDDICRIVNENEEAKTHGVTAQPYRARYLDARYSDYLPDVWLDKPDTMFPFRSDAFVTENPWYGPVASVNGLPMSIYTGLKGRHPLLCCDQATANAADASDDRNLTLAYKLINRILA